MIRNVRLNDFDKLYELFIKIPTFQKNVFNEYDAAKTRRAFALCTIGGFAKIVEHNNKIVGCMFGTISENHWGVKIAMDLVTYSTRETPALIKLFTQWAKENGAAQVIIANSYGSERYSKLIEKMGFTPDTQTFIRRL